MGIEIPQHKNKELCIIKTQKKRNFGSGAEMDNYGGGSTK